VQPGLHGGDTADLAVALLHWSSPRQPGREGDAELQHHFATGEVKQQ
jgi:hypothetical protein